MMLKTRHAAAGMRFLSADTSSSTMRTPAFAPARAAAAWSWFTIAVVFAAAAAGVV